MGGRSLRLKASGRKWTQLHLDDTITTLKGKLRRTNPSDLETQYLIVYSVLSWEGKLQANLELFFFNKLFFL